MYCCAGVIVLLRTPVCIGEETEPGSGSRTRVVGLALVVLRGAVHQDRQLDSVLEVERIGLHVVLTLKFPLA